MVFIHGGEVGILTSRPFIPFRALEEPGRIAAADQGQISLSWPPAWITLRTIDRLSPDRDPGYRRAEMNTTLTLIDLAGAVALLIWGVHMVQTGVMRAFGPQLRRSLGYAFANRMKAFLAGLGVTAILQSSTATGLMVTTFAAGTSGLWPYGGGAVAVGFRDPKYGPVLPDVPDDDPHRTAPPEWAAQPPPNPM